MNDPTLVHVTPHEATRPPLDLDPIARRHGPWLLRWFERRTHEGDAEDLIQEVLLSLVRNASQVRDPERIAGYLLTAAKRILRDSIDQRDRSVGRTLDEPLAPSPPEDDRSLRLRAAMRALPPELEQAIDVYYTREITYEECADTLGISRSLLQSRLRRAKEILRRQLSDRPQGRMAGQMDDTPHSEVQP